MRERRCSFSVVVLDGNIYAIGGHCDPAYLDNVERYCPTANSWRYVLGGHGCCCKVTDSMSIVYSIDNMDLMDMELACFILHNRSGSGFLV